MSSPFSKAYSPLKRLKGFFQEINSPFSPSGKAEEIFEEILPMSKDVVLRVLCVGDSGVGKTSMIMTFLDGVCPETIEETDERFEIYQNPEKYSVTTNGNVRYEICDYRGNVDSNQFREDIEQNIKLDFDVVLVFFSMVDRTSFRNVRRVWYPRLVTSLPDVQVILIGSKSDLISDPEVLERMKKDKDYMITYDEAIEWSKYIAARNFLLSSCKLMGTLDDIFDDCVHLKTKVDYKSLILGKSNNFKLKNSYKEHQKQIESFEESRMNE